MMWGMAIIISVTSVKVGGVFVSAIAIVCAVIIRSRMVRADAIKEQHGCYKDPYCKFKNTLKESLQYLDKQ
tara:strand:+ start:144 stop:356 length:213 start_codon:yes stop_codon:yes gene_type:complete